MLVHYTCLMKDQMNASMESYVLQVDLHYNGFCNSVLWQLFHYIPLNLESKLSDTRTLNFQWKAHQEANRKFAEVTSAYPCLACSRSSTAEVCNGVLCMKVRSNDGKDKGEDRPDEGLSRIVAMMETAMETAM